MGKEQKDYAEWILKPNNWGGDVELMVLSDYFQCEIVAVDTVTLKYYPFGIVSSFMWFILG